MALTIDMCRVMVDLKSGKAQVQVGLVDGKDKDLRKGTSLSPTLSAKLLTDIKNEVNAALTAEKLPDIK